MKKEGSKRENGPNFCFDFWVRFGDHRALYHIPIVIIPTLSLCVQLSKRKSQNYRRFPLKEKEGEERHVSKLFYGKIQKKSTTLCIQADNAKIS